MRTQRLAALVCALGIGLAAPASALAAPDPCKPTKQNPNPCQNVPEAPLALLYPAAGGLVLLGFIAAEARRRRRPGATDQG